MVMSQWSDHNGLTEQFMQITTSALERISIIRRTGEHRYNQC